MDIHDLLAQALPDDLALAPAEPLLRRGRRARRIRRYRNAALASVVAVALAATVATIATTRPVPPDDPAVPQPSVSCTAVTPDNTAQKVECPPPKPPRPSEENP